MQEKKAVVSGASGIVGAAIVKKLKAQGYKVCALGHKRVFDQSLGLESSDLTLYCDIASDTEVRAAWAEIEKWSKNLNLLVNSAGVAFAAPAAMTPIADIKDVFDVNFYGAIRLSQKAIRRMLKSENPSIINILSVQAHIAQPGSMAYGCSKAALAYATRLMNREFSAFGVRVNGISPTVIDSEMGDMMDAKSQDYLKKLSASNTLLSSDSVADCVIFLASDHAKDIAGQIIKIDGGIDSF